MISNRTGTTTVYPRLLIHKESGAIVNNGPPDAPIEFCEYADGANNNAGFAQATKVATLDDAGTAMRTPLGMGIGGSLDCDSTQVRPPSGTVSEIWVPAATTIDDSFYDVATTFTFGAP